MRAAERNLRLFTEERQTKLDDLEKISEELTQSDALRERMKFEENQEKWQSEFDWRGTMNK